MHRSRGGTTTSRAGLWNLNQINAQNADIAMSAFFLLIVEIPFSSVM